MSEVDRLENAWAKICEHFPEALLIVKDHKEGTMRWRSTDSTWAYGASNRYMDSIKNNDQLDALEYRAKNEQG